MCCFIKSYPLVLVLVSNLWFWNLKILPHQVLGFAAFFALVLKKVDQEEYGEPQIDTTLRNTGTFVSAFLLLCIFIFFLHVKHTLCFVSHLSATLSLILSLVSSESLFNISNCYDVPLARIIWWPAHLKSGWSSNQNVGNFTEKQFFLFICWYWCCCSEFDMEKLNADCCIDGVIAFGGGSMIVWGVGGILITETRPVVNEGHLNAVTHWDETLQPMAIPYLHNLVT